jgi:hypothetical protein
MTYRKFPLNKFAFNRQTAKKTMLTQEQIDQMNEELKDTYPNDPEDIDYETSLERDIIAAPIYENFESVRRQNTRP